MSWTSMTAAADEEHELLLKNARKVLLRAVYREGLSQRELAERALVSEAQISRVLHGNDTISLRTFARVAAAVGARFELVEVGEE